LTNFGPDCFKTCLEQPKDSFSAHILLNMVMTMSSNFRPSDWKTTHIQVSKGMQLERANYIGNQD